MSELWDAASSCSSQILSMDNDQYQYNFTATWLGVRSYGMLPRKGSVAVGAPLYIVPSQQLLGYQVTNEKRVGPSLPSVGWKTPPWGKEGEIKRNTGQTVLKKRKKPP